MKNSVYMLVEKEKFQYMQTELYELENDYVRVKNLYCGICGGDYSTFLGHRNHYPYTLGHEFIAEVIDIGKSVTSLAKGDFVVSDFNYRCGTCKYCMSGKSHLCMDNNIQRFSNRAFSTYMNVHFSYLHKIALMPDIWKATLIEPLSCVIHAFNSTKHMLSNPKTILIMGAGSIGTLFGFYLKIIKNVENVYIYDIIPERMQRNISYFQCLPYSAESNMEFDLIIDATNSIDGIQNTLDISGMGQKLCIMSHLYGLETSFIYEKICQKELQALFPLRNGEPENIELAAQYIADFWTAQYADMFEIFPLEHIQQAFDKKATSTNNKQIIQI